MGGSMLCFLFFFNDTATTEIYTLSLHDALPISVNAVASRISLPSHVSREDLLSCAKVALVEVARRFDPSSGASFATYALARLQGAVLDELRSGDWASRSVRAAARRTDAAADAPTITLGRPPTREELAASLGAPRSELDSQIGRASRRVRV